MPRNPKRTAIFDIAPFRSFYMCFANTISLCVLSNAMLYRSSCIKYNLLMGNDCILLDFTVLQLFIFYSKVAVVLSLFVQHFFLDSMQFTVEMNLWPSDIFFFHLVHGKLCWSERSHNSKKKSNLSPVNVWTFIFFFPVNDKNYVEYTQCPL